MGRSPSHVSGRLDGMETVWDVLRAMWGSVEVGCASRQGLGTPKTTWTCIETWGPGTVKCRLYIAVDSEAIPTTLVGSS